MGSKKVSKATSKENLMLFDTRTGSCHQKKAPVATEQLRAVIYCRVSDMQQVREGHGLEGQERVCRERCEKHSPAIIVEEVFVERGISGAKKERKALNECMSYLKKRNKAASFITHFVVTEASRISRPEDIGDAFAIEGEIMGYGVKISKVNSGGMDESTDEGILFKTIQYAISGYERKMIVRRANNGRVSRLKSGYRPFAAPPTGYYRERLPNREYIDHIDPIKGPIVQEGLELFASDVLITQYELWKFWNDKGLRTSQSKGDRLRRTFPEKALKLHRLFYYSGYILYPDRGVNEPIEGQHLGIISLDTVYKIIEKLQNTNKAYSKSHRVKRKIVPEHPLRGMIRCPGCQRNFCSRNTKKYKGKGEERTYKLYPYYGCTNNSCTDKEYIRQHVLEEEFENFLLSMKVGKGMSKLIEHLFKRRREEYLGQQSQIRENKSKRLVSLRNKQKQIEESLMRTKNIKLSEKLEEQWSEMDSQIDDLEKQLESKSRSNHEMKKMLHRTKILFENPVDVWKRGNHSMRKLLINVRFGAGLYYTKKEGFKTIQDGSLYSIMNELMQGDTLICTARNGPRTCTDHLMDRLIQTIRDYSEPIGILWKHLEYHDVLSDFDLQGSSLCFHDP